MAVEQDLHAFGLAWYEQYRDGTAIRFRQHVIMNKEPQENKYGVKFSELHAIDLVDIDGRSGGRSGLRGPHYTTVPGSQIRSNAPWPREMTNP